MGQLKELYSSQAIQSRVKELGKQISQDFYDLDNPVVIGVMKGAVCFLTDLMRELKTKDPWQLEFVRLSSYGAAKESSGTVQTPYLDLPNLYERNILVVEDIIDSGRTAQFFLNYLKEQYNPNILKIATFLSKPSRRVLPLDPDYIGYTIDDLFVIGYGLDLIEKYREIPYLAIYEQ